MKLADKHQITSSPFMQGFELSSDLRCSCGFMARVFGGRERTSDLAIQISLVTLQHQVDVIMNTELPTGFEVHLNQVDVIMNTELPTGFEVHLNQRIGSVDKSHGMGFG